MVVGAKIKNVFKKCLTIPLLQGAQYLLGLSVPDNLPSMTAHYNPDPLHDPNSDPNRGPHAGAVLESHPGGLCGVQGDR